ncbi:MAG: thiamine-phosphate kinase [Acidimicrobiales bacterium]
MTGELDAIRQLRRRLPGPPPGEVWIGDDTAVLVPPKGAWALLAADAVVEGVHADLSLLTLADLGWRAVVANVSDVAAMGGLPAHCVVTVAGRRGLDLDALYDGIAEAAETYTCPVVGGDLVASPVTVVTVAVTGTVDGPPVLRSGARPGDGVWVTGALGASAAGLRQLRAGSADPALASAHCRPRPLVAEGGAARRAGATAMIDVSDGFAADLWHVADASGIGFELDEVPIAAGATLEEALGGGEDYQLVFTAPAGDAVRAAFAGLPDPVLVGRCTDEPGAGRLAGASLPRLGWQHDC